MKFSANPITAVLFLVATAATVHAGLVVTVDGTGLTAPAETIDFSEVSVGIDGTVLDNQFASLGVTFSGMYYNSRPFDPAQGSVLSPVAENFDIDFAVTDPFSMSFTEVQTEVAFNLLTIDGETTTFDVYNGNDLVGTDTETTDFSGSQFYGFSGVSFDRIQLTVSTNSSNGEAAIDNLQLGKHTVPVAGVPDGGSTAALVGLAVGVLALGARRTRK